MKLDLDFFAPMLPFLRSQNILVSACLRQPSMMKWQIIKHKLKIQNSVYQNINCVQKIFHHIDTISRPREILNLREIFVFNIK